MNRELGEKPRKSAITKGEEGVSFQKDEVVNRGSCHRQVKSDNDRKPPSGMVVQLRTGV